MNHHRYHTLFGKKTPPDLKVAGWANDHGLLREQSLPGHQMGRDGLATFHQICFSPEKR